MDGFRCRTPDSDAIPRDLQAVPLIGVRLAAIGPETRGRRDAVETVASELEGDPGCARGEGDTGVGLEIVGEVDRDGGQLRWVGDSEGVGDYERSVVRARRRGCWDQGKAHALSLRQNHPSRLPGLDEGQVGDAARG